MSINKTEILNNICYTELVYGRINKKLDSRFSKIEIEKMMYDTIKEIPEESFQKIGKNIYCINSERNIKITINSNTYRIITVDKTGLTNTENITNGLIFILRPWQQSDLGNLVKYANNPNIACNLTDAFPSPYTKTDGEAYLNMICNQTPANVFTIDINGEAVGSIGVFPQADIHRMNAEIGYWLAEPFWNKGIMPEAVKQMVRYAFETFEINRIFARPFGRNRASQRVLEKAGFKFEASFKKVLIKNGQLEDELIYAMRRPA